MTLTETQWRYVQIERKLQAVEFGLDRSRQWSRRQTRISLDSTAETDSTGLTEDSKDEIADAAARFQTGLQA